MCSNKSIMNLMKSLSLIVCLTLTVAGNSVYGQDAQQWEFAFVSGGQVISRAVASCKAGGVCDASSWVILSKATFGCDFKLDFTVQFSGTAVRLMLFHKTLDSDCDGIMLSVATGTGYSNASYPAAITAEGDITLTYKSPADREGELLPASSIFPCNA